jgi:hypothetical protein
MNVYSIHADVNQMGLFSDISLGLCDTKENCDKVVNMINEYIDKYGIRFVKKNILSEFKFNIGNIHGNIDKIYTKEIPVMSSQYTRLINSLLE